MSSSQGVALDGFRPDRYDPHLAGIYLLSVVVIISAPRAASPGRQRRSLRALGG